MSESITEVAQKWRPARKSGKVVGTPLSLEEKSDAVSAVAVEPQVAQLLADTSLPEPVRRFLQSGATLESIYLDAEGRWFHQGEPFVNEALALLFTRSLVRTAGGTWMLSIPPV